MSIASDLLDNSPDNHSQESQQEVINRLIDEYAAATAEAERLVLLNNDYINEISFLYATIEALRIKAVALQTGRANKSAAEPAAEPATQLSGSAAHVKSLLPWRFGEILMNTDRLSIPFALLKEYRAYRQEEEKRNGAPLPVLADFSDAEKGRELCKMLPYKLGKAFLRDVSSPPGWFRLPFSLRKVRREHQETLAAQKHGAPAKG